MEGSVGNVGLRVIPRRPRSQKLWTFVRRSATTAWRRGGNADENTLMRPLFSATKTRPSGEKRIAVGLVRPLDLAVSVNPGGTAAEAVASPGRAGLAGSSAPTSASAAITLTADDDGRPPRDCPPLAATQSLPTGRAVGRPSYTGGGSSLPSGEPAVSQLRPLEATGFRRLPRSWARFGPHVPLRPTVRWCSSAPARCHGGARAGAPVSWVGKGAKARRDTLPREKCRENA